MLKVNIRALIFRTRFAHRRTPAIAATSAGILVAFFLTAGCAHYRLGTGAAPAFRTLYIEPVANRTLLPQSQALLSTRLRESFARDHRVALANSAETADATLSIVVTEYRREVSADRENDTGLARKFNITLGVTCALRDNRAGKTLFEGRPVSAMRGVFTDSGQLQTEYQTLALLAEALAGKVVHAALDVW
ncbi:MAG: hypothetical protein EXS38_02265 [Opitutus sp.]|nr:hypothetical protein [Opitutus sp.]